MVFALSIQIWRFHRQVAAKCNTSHNEELEEKQWRRISDGKRDKGEESLGRCMLRERENGCMSVAFGNEKKQYIYTESNA